MARIDTGAAATPALGTMPRAGFEPARHREADRGDAIHGNWRYCGQKAGALAAVGVIGLTQASPVPLTDGGTPAGFTAVALQGRPGAGSSAEIASNTEQSVSPRLEPGSAPANPSTGGGSAPDAGRPGGSNAAPSQIATLSIDPSIEDFDVSPAMIPAPPVADTADEIMLAGMIDDGTEPVELAESGGETEPVGVDGGGSWLDAWSQFGSPGGSQQSNVAITDNDATAIAGAITYIDQISDSIVFIGGNIAVAAAINYAPLTQMNLYAGGGYGGSATQAAITDNDASAIAIAGTFINNAYGSIIVLASNIAEASAFNQSPVTQFNFAGHRFSDTDTIPTSALLQANLSISDNDSDALAGASLFVNNAVDSTALLADANPMTALPSLPPGGLSLHPLWDDYADTFDSVLA